MQLIADQDLTIRRGIRLRAEVGWRTAGAAARDLCRRVLSPREMRRLMSIGHERAARDSMQAAALACRALAWLEQEIARGGRRPGVRWLHSGRPVFTGVARASLSLTHGGGYVAVAVNFSGRVGIDVEGRRPLNSALVETTMAAEERIWIDAAPDTPSREERFAHLWVLKEALCKAAGMGLAIDPLDMCFSIENGRARLVRSPVAGAWSFHLTGLPGGVACGLCHQAR